jgi:hypothetical protein
VKFIEFQEEYGPTFINLDHVADMNVVDSGVYVEKSNGKELRFKMESEQEAAKLTRFMRNNSVGVSFKGKVSY